MEMFLTTKLRIYVKLNCLNVKMDLALNNLQRLKCHKNPNKRTNHLSIEEVHFCLNIFILFKTRASLNHSNILLASHYHGLYVGLDSVKVDCEGVITF